MSCQVLGAFESRFSLKVHRFWVSAADNRSVEASLLYPPSEAEFRLILEAFGCLFGAEIDQKSTKKPPGEPKRVVEAFCGYLPEAFSNIVGPSLAILGPRRAQDGLPGGVLEPKRSRNGAPGARKRRKAGGGLRAPFLRGSGTVFGRFLRRAEPKKSSFYLSKSIVFRKSARALPKAIAADVRPLFLAFGSPFGLSLIHI